MIISATGSTVRNALAEARRVASLSLAAYPEVLRNEGDDNCYRCHLAGGVIVEVTVASRTRASAHVYETCRDPT